jgi:hypothetical protein
MLIENDNIKTGVEVSRKCYQSYEKKHRVSGIFYEEIVMYYNKPK